MKRTFFRMTEMIFQVTKRPSGATGRFRHMTKFPGVVARPFFHVTESVDGVKKPLFLAAGGFCGVNDGFCHMKF
ncbi:hypothetical protein [Zoogloea sp.]|uniref:hypothetical protein n=1 Tax=Zoogloea sp. TaxID=49181 RepID=UPI0035AF9122